jgi:hypothetical protein
MEDNERAHERDRGSHDITQKVGTISMIKYIHTFIHYEIHTRLSRSFL